jgi:hypothetical protein
MSGSGGYDLIGELEGKWKEFGCAVLVGSDVGNYYTGSVHLSKVYSGALI